MMASRKPVEPPKPMGVGAFKVTRSGHHRCLVSWWQRTDVPDSLWRGETTGSEMTNKEVSMEVREQHNTIHWFRKGLRFHDNPSLLHALRTSRHVYPVFVMDLDFMKDFKIRSGANQWRFVIECLQDLDTRLRAYGLRLFVARGNAEAFFAEHFRKWNITQLTHDVETEHYHRFRDAAGQHGGCSSYRKYIDRTGDDTSGKNLKYIHTGAATSVKPQVQIHTGVSTNSKVSTESSQGTALTRVKCLHTGEHTSIHLHVHSHVREGGGVVLTTVKCLHTGEHTSSHLRVHSHVREGGGVAFTAVKCLHTGKHTSSHLRVHSHVMEAGGVKRHGGEGCRVGRIEQGGWWEGEGSGGQSFPDNSSFQFKVTRSGHHRCLVSWWQRTDVPDSLWRGETTACLGEASHGDGQVEPVGRGGRSSGQGILRAAEVKHAVVTAEGRRKTSRISILLRSGTWGTARRGESGSKAVILTAERQFLTEGNPEAYRTTRRVHEVIQENPHRIEARGCGTGEEVSKQVLSTNNAY
uniref:Photolyase/cryptochrome alpha/beta domain-containing protein n=1 Tax=Branchiostoma floridae TaxID=7739 RepID=C3ZS89_BRAFL|eukprot:XP_002588610.1 hypothetical protein BRAFLDRAFT_131753 [Branchiostoma floridae]